MAFNNRVISVPSIFVNNEPISIVPNSFKFKLGKGETNVRAASVGGGASVSIHSENAESQVGEIKFAMYTTTDNIARVNLWKSNTGANAVQAIQRSQVPISLQNASMTNDPEIEATADGKMEVEFKGDSINAIF
jgi:hypothetical protein